MKPGAISHKTMVVVWMLAGMAEIVRETKEEPGDQGNFSVVQDHWSEGILRTNLIGDCVSSTVPFTFIRRPTVVDSPKRGS